MLPISTSLSSDSSSSVLTHSSVFTPTGVRRSGDDYQDIIALKFMVHWLENPRLYTRMVVEDDDQDNKFLDDVRLDKSDGTVVARQVKFSAHPENADDAWTWEKLLAQREGKERADGTRRELPSLLQKWSQTWVQLTTPSGGTIQKVDAAVVSNRRAAPDLATALDANGYVDFDSIAAPDVRAEIIRQVGDEETTRAFFAGFRFELEHPSYEGLSDGLQRRLRTLGGNEDGWNNLQVELRSWVRHRELPPPKGDITLPEIRRAMRWYQLQSLPQEFVIPPDYVLPDHEFHALLLNELLSLDGECRVLTASPGIGKSTYCSALYRELRKRGVPAVRHHYFLSLSDPRATYSAYERLNHRRAAESLMHDLAWEHSEALSATDSRNPRPEDLRHWLVECGEYYATQGKNLIVILDGLDHIWREAGSIDELRQLLDYLLPAPPGVVVLMATQSVEDEKLPTSLLRHAPREGWFELPFLHLNSIRHWLWHHKAEIWPEENIEETENVQEPNNTRRMRRRVDDYQLNQLAQAFYDKSKGHPLHLRYSLKALQEQGQPVMESTVEELPPCPHENISEYYRLLELRLSEEGRQILHLLATSRFSWPREGLFECLAPAPLDQPRVIQALRNVEHLLINDELGLRPFHGSLLVWLEEQPNHALHAALLRPRIIEWLSSRAPESWRWAYEWTLRADTGDVTPLRDGPNRDWTVEAVALRRSGHEIGALLARAGWCALEAREIPRALELGLLADYVHNTYEYYNHHLEPLLVPQLFVEEDPYLRPRLYAAQDECTDIELAILAEAEWRRGDIKRVRYLFDELVHRLNTNQSRSSSGNEPSFNDSSDAILRVAALLPVTDEAAPVGESEVERIVRWALRQREHNSGYGEDATPQSRRILAIYARCARAFGNAAALRRVLRITLTVPGDIFDEINETVEMDDATTDEAALSAEPKDEQLQATNEVEESQDEEEPNAPVETFDLRLWPEERQSLLHSAIWLALEKELNFDDVLSQDRNDPFVALYFLTRGEAQLEAAPLDSDWPDAGVLTLSESRSLSARENIAVMFYDTFFRLLINSWRGRDEENQTRLATLRTQIGANAWALRFLERLHLVAVELTARIRTKTLTSFAWFFEQLQSLPLPYYVGYIREGEGHHGIRARLATGRIGADVWTLLGALGLRETPLVPLDEFHRALQSDYLLAETWLTKVNELRSKIFSPEDAKRYLEDEREKLDAKVTDLNERAEAWTELATFAALHHLPEEAILLIRRTAGCLVAHYFHKEISLFTLLDSVRTLYTSLETHAQEIGIEQAEAGRQELRDSLLEIARVTACVADFTDGDETGHLPEELAKTLEIVAPEWLPDYFVEGHEREDFMVARATFEDWLRSADLNDPVQVAIASTALSSNTLEILRTREGSGDAGARDVLARTLAFCGDEALIPRLRQESDSSSSPSSESTPPPPADYPPDQIEKFFAELERCGFYVPQREVAEWIEFWGEREPEAAISALEAALKQRGRRGSWDGLFTIVRRRHGKEKAYPYLVQAHREAMSWYFYYSSRDQSRVRWHQVRDFYPSKWFDFLLDTTRGEKIPWEGPTLQRVSLGYSTWAHLTEYLVIQKQFDLARSCVKMMVQCALWAASPVPLIEPQWVAQVQRSQTEDNAIGDEA